MNCARCQKRLSRKTARLIDGKVMCSPCMFGRSDAEIVAEVMRRKNAGVQP